MTFAPAVTGSSTSILVTERSALSGFTVVLAVAVLFAGVGSFGVALIVAVLLMEGTEAPVVATTSVKTSLAAAATDGFVQLTVPLAPTAGVLHVHPTAAANETNVVLAGSGSLRVAEVPGPGPALETVIVYVRFPPTVSAIGKPVFVTAMSASSELLSKYTVACGSPVRAGVAIFKPFFARKSPLREA